MKSPSEPCCPHAAVAREDNKTTEKIAEKIIGALGFPINKGKSLIWNIACLVAKEEEIIKGHWSA